MKSKSTGLDTMTDIDVEIQYLHDLLTRLIEEQQIETKITSMK